jgi:hypothetical protein
MRGPLIVRFRLTDDGCSISIHVLRTESLRLLENGCMDSELLALMPLQCDHIAAATGDACSEFIHCLN